MHAWGVTRTGGYATFKRGGFGNPQLSMCIIYLKVLESPRNSLRNHNLIIQQDFIVLFDHTILNVYTFFVEVDSQAIVCLVDNPPNSK